MKSKKGQGLPMNTIVIAALVLIVLVVLIGHWVGGPTCPASQVPIYNVKNADEYPGQTCCFKPKPVEEGQ